MRWQPRPVFIFFIIVLLYWAFIIFPGCHSDLQPVQKNEIKEAYLGSVTCKSCHTAEYNDWLKSDHFQAMHLATDSTVLGDFNNTSFVADGVTNTFFKKEGKFYINTQGEDGLNHDYEVLYTFGYFPLQQYLIAFPGGRMQATRVTWDSRDKKWFHQYAGQKMASNDWLHWTGNGQNWNTMCASCHSTDLQKNYDVASDAYHTTWSEVNVTCENCHGPGSRHVDFIQSAAFKNGERIKNAGFVYGRDTTPQIQLNACAACHARKSDIAQETVHSDEIMDDLIPQVISTENYFADGQIRDEDYEYGSFTQSKMFNNGVQCSNCHNPHSGKLRRTGNELCLQCHKPTYDSPTHHFHKADTEESLCINCHMPVKTFMGIDHRRDHSFRIPRPDQSIIYGTPNACTSCHVDKTFAWAAKTVTTWYGPTRRYHFSDDLAPGSVLDEQSEHHLIKLLADTSQPEIARATAAFYLGSIQTRKSAEALNSGMKDEKPLVRYHALKSMENFPEELWMEAAIPLLSDKVRAVRIAAADLFHRLPPSSIQAMAKEAYMKADSENQRFLLYQTDFALGNVMLADYQMQSGNYVSAIDYYQKGLKKDNQMNYARFNLSAAYSTMAKNEEALKTLQEAAMIDPNNERVYYNLGLLYYEMKNEALALENFRKADQLGSQNQGLYYNYGILLQQQGKWKEAEQILLKGLALNPQAPGLNYALAYLYMSQRLPQKARPYAIVLYQLDPHKQDYQELFSNLGIANQ
jgi:predicted CXXCH cytochrome family protein